jgi:uroporphyrinogen decarboxylase
MEVYMNCKDRVLKALAVQIPDKVPYMYSVMDKEIQEKILGEDIDIETVSALRSWGSIGKPGKIAEVDPVITISPLVARKLKLDAIGVQYLPPLFIEARVTDGRAEIKDGILTDREVFQKCELPDPDDDRMYDVARDLVSKYKEEFALYARVRLGVSSTLLSMGTTGFAYALQDDPALVKEIVKMYTEWTAKVVKNLIEIGVDFLWCFDDIAFKATTMFSLDTWKEFFEPYIEKTAKGINVPWIFHSDGNILPFLDELLKLGMSGIHPLEPGAMDLGYLKKNYGSRLCLIGNVDIDYTLSKGSVSEVFDIVHQRIKQLGPGGGYIISDSNSIPSYCLPENVIAMSEAVEKYRYIY